MDIHSYRKRVEMISFVDYNNCYAGLCLCYIHMVWYRVKDAAERRPVPANHVGFHACVRLDQMRGYNAHKRRSQIPSYKRMTNRMF
jgi:hypothetical protein